VEGVLGFYVESVDVVEKVHPRFRPPRAETTNSLRCRALPRFTFQAMTASRTTPTLCVLVIMIGPSRKPESSSQVVPVISPLPLSVNQAPKTASSGCFFRAGEWRLRRCGQGLLRL
jgi:hypothetical protein